MIVPLETNSTPKDITTLIKKSVVKWMKVTVPVGLWPKLITKRKIMMEREGKFESKAPKIWHVLTCIAKTWIQYYITYLEPLVHENVFVKKLREFVSSASVPRVEVSPKELCALLHQGWQHVLFGCIANVTDKLEGTQVDVVSVNVPEKQDGMYTNWIKIASIFDDS